MNRLRATLFPTNLPLIATLLTAALGLAMPSIVLRSVPTFSLLVIAIMLGLFALPKPALLAHLKTSLRTPTSYLVIAFLAFTAFTNHLALNPHYAWHYWKILATLALSSWLLTAIAATLPPTAHAQVIRWLHVGFWLSLAAAVIIIVGEPTFERLNLYDAGNAWTQTRLRFYSSVLAVYLPFCWVTWLTHPHPTRSWQPIALIGISLMAVILCAGRAGWLGAGASLPVTLWLLYRYHNLRLPFLRSAGIIALAGVIGMGLYTALFGLASVKERLGFVSTPRGLGGGRLEIWRMALQHIPDHPLTGIGLNNFRFIPGADYHPHNFVLQLLLETGLPGALIAFALLATLLTKLYRRATSSLYAVAGFAGLCGFMIAGLTNKSIFAPDWLIILIVVSLFGLCFKPTASPAATR